MPYTSRTPGTASSLPLNQPGSIRLLWWIALVVLIGSTVMLVFNLVNQVGVRPGAPILMGVGLTMLILLRWQKFTLLVAWLLCLGGLFSSFMASYGTLGLLSMSWLTMPVVIMVSGWLLGRSAVFITTSLSLIAIGVMYLLHLDGHQFPQNYTLGTVVTGLMTTMLVAGLVAGSLAGVFQQQLAQLDEARTHLTTLFDSLDDLIWTVDTRHFGLLSFNQAFADYMLAAKGVRLAIGMTPAQLNSADAARAWWSDLYQRALVAGSLRVEHASGEERVHQISLHLMRREGEAFAISVIAHNITEERMVQQRLEQAVQQRTRELSIAKETAEIANQSKGYFLANMSHEIRTPLTAILGFAESLRDRHLSESERMQAVHTVIRNSLHLQGLISDILDFSKIEAGQLEIERIPVALPELLADMASLGQALAKNHALDFSSHLLPPLPSLIETDITRLRQILINLLGNAVKFTRSPGRVRLLVSSDPATGTLLFTVQDSGIGMGQDTLTRLFKPFVQADASTTRRFGGTGLGLSISRELALRLGGDIQVSSIEHLGSLFMASVAIGQAEGMTWLESPQQWTKQATPDEGGQNGLDSHGGLAGRVLLAEDTVDNQRLISLLLKRTGVNLTIVQNGQEAVERVQEDEFDLILMDMQMPVMGGLEATHLLRLTGFDKPIVALTANATELGRSQALAAGCTDFLSKPLNQAAFFHILTRYLPTRVPDDANAAPPALLHLTDDPDYRILRDSFMDELPTRLAAIQTALAEEDWEGLRFRAHQLKGVAGSFGFRETSRTSGQIEACVASGDYRPLDQLVQTLLDSARQSGQPD
ncbi:MAG: hypothetical protein RLZZ226_1890 [Pseudomonadota bacterium]